MDRHDMNFIDIDRYIPATVCSQYPSSISHNARATMTPCLEHTLSYAAMSIILSCIWARLISRIQTPALVQFTSHITTTLGLLIMIFAMASSASATASPSSVLVDPPPRSMHQATLLDSSGEYCHRLRPWHPHLHVGGYSVCCISKPRATC